MSEREMKAEVLPEPIPNQDTHEKEKPKQKLKQS